MRPQLSTLLLSVALTIVGTSSDAQVPLTTIRVASGLEKPVQATAPAGDCERIFIVDQSGQILVLSQEQFGATPTQMFLDISSKVAPPDRIWHDRSEQGLLSMAFHPSYDENGYFYVHYIETGPDLDPEAIIIGDSVIARYSVSGDPNVALAESEERVLVVDNNTENHNGGMIAFSPNDGFLYISLGIMSGSGPEGLDLSLLQGKLLRLDVNSDDFPDEEDRNYAIPTTNPFVGVEGARGEIWSQGLRNPWRFSFDRDTGDLYLGDVGGGTREELNFQLGTSVGGENYGFNTYEGTVCRSGDGCDPDGVTFPVLEREHTSNVKESIIGGYVYRGDRIPDLVGTYIYGDWWVEGSTSEPVPDGMSKFWSLRMVNGEVTEHQERTDEFDPGDGLTISNLTSFGEDGTGEIYICARADVDTLGQGTGEVYKIVAADDTEPMTICPTVDDEFTRGDCNNDGELDISDGVFNLIVLFFSDRPPECAEACNANNDAQNDVSDALFVFNYLFVGGAELEAPFPTCGSDAGDSLGCVQGACD